MGLARLQLNLQRLPLTLRIFQSLLCLLPPLHLLPNVLLLFLYNRLQIQHPLLHSLQLQSSPATLLLAGPLTCHAT